MSVRLTDAALPPSKCVVGIGAGARNVLIDLFSARTSGHAHKHVDDG